MTFKSHVILTLSVVLALILLPSVGYGQIVQGAKVNDTVTNCQISTPTVGVKTSYIAVDAQGHPCMTIVPSSNNDGLSVKGVTTNSTAGSAQVVSVLATPGQIYGITVDAGANTSNTVVWLNFFNALTTTPGTTGALFSISTSAGTGTLGTLTPMPWGAPVGIPFSTALTVNCTTTKNGATGCQSPANITVLTK